MKAQALMPCWVDKAASLNNLVWQCQTVHSSFWLFCSEKAPLSANSWCTGMFLCTDFLVLIQRSYIDLLSYSIVHCHIMANVQFCKTCVSVIDKVQRHMHIFTWSKCQTGIYSHKARQAVLSQVLLSHWFQLSIQLLSLYYINNVLPRQFQLSRPLCFMLSIINCMESGKYGWMFLH